MTDWQLIVSKSLALDGFLRNNSPVGLWGWLLLVGPGIVWPISLLMR